MTTESRYRFRGPEANPKDAFPIPGYEHLSMDLRRDIHSAFANIEAMRSYVEWRLKALPAAKTQPFYVEICTDLIQCKSIEQFAAIIVKLLNADPTWLIPKDALMTNKWGFISQLHYTLAIVQDHPLTTRLATHYTRRGQDQSATHMYHGFEERLHVDRHADDLISEPLNNLKHIPTAERHHRVILDQLWKSRAAEAYIHDGPRAAVAAVATILFEECGYRHPPLVLDELSRRFPKIFPPKTYSYDDLLRTQKGNCTQKAEAARVILEHINYVVKGRAYDKQSVRTILQGAYKGNFDASFMSTPEYPRLWSEYQSKNAALENIWTAEQRCRVSDLPDMNAILRYADLESEIFLFAEYSRQTVFAGWSIEHERVIARCREKDGTLKYYVIEPGAEGVICKFKPTEGNAYRQINRGGHYPDFHLYGLLARELHLPQDFVFYKEPQVGKKTQMNLVTPTVHEQRLEAPSPHTVEETLIIPLAACAALAELSPVADRDIEVNMPNAAETPERATSPELRPVLSRMRELVVSHPYLTAGSALTAALSGLMYISDHERAQQDIAQNILDAAEQVDASPEPTAQLARLADTSTAEKNIEKDVLLAQPFAPHIANALDLASRVSSVQSVAVELDGHTSEYAASDKVHSLVHTATAADTHRLTVTLSPAVRTVGPSFWVPLLRKASSYGERVALHISGEGIDHTAVASSFVDLWNRIRSTDASLHTLTILINGERVFSAVQDGVYRTNTSFDTHFIVDPEYGHLTPVPETLRAAQEACAHHTAELPSKWRTPQAALWVRPLCELTTTE